MSEKSVQATAGALPMTIARRIEPEVANVPGSREDQQRGDDQHGVRPRQVEKRGDGPAEPHQPPAE